MRALTTFLNRLHCEAEMHPMCSDAPFAEKIISFTNFEYHIIWIIMIHQAETFVIQTLVYHENSTH